MDGRRRVRQKGRAEGRGMGRRTDKGTKWIEGGGLDRRGEQERMDRRREHSRRRL